jgi:hypothetical protein
MEATMSAFLTVGFFTMHRQTHDELESKFVVATSSVLAPKATRDISSGNS